MLRGKSMEKSWINRDKLLLHTAATARSELRAGLGRSHAGCAVTVCPNLRRTCHPPKRTRRRGSHLAEEASPARISGPAPLRSIVPSPAPVSPIISSFRWFRCGAALRSRAYPGREVRRESPRARGTGPARGLVHARRPPAVAPCAMGASEPGFGHLRRVAVILGAGCRKGGSDAG